MQELVNTVYHYVVHILVTVAAAVLLYASAKGAKKLFKAYQEIFVMWTIAFGQRWMPESKSLRIQPFFCRTSELDDVSVQECFRFHFDAFCTAENISQEKLLRLYREVLLSYSHILFCRDRLDGSLRGLVLLGLMRKQTYSILKIGLMLTHRHYRGGPWMRLACACMIIRELFLHPRTPLYVIGKISTYKTYLIASQFPDCFPRYDRETPEIYKTIAEDFMTSQQLPSDSFNRDTLVLRRRFGVMKGHVAAISERDLSNPHINFFNKHNPGWREGDQLVTLVKMTWRMWLNNMLRVALRQLTYSTTSNSTVPRGISSAGNVDGKKARRFSKNKQYLRGISFQDTEASLYSMRYYTYEYGKEDGSTILQPQSVRKPSLVDRMYSYEEDEDLSVDFNF